MDHAPPPPLLRLLHEAAAVRWFVSVMVMIPEVAKVLTFVLKLKYKYLLKIL